MVRPAAAVKVKMQQLEAQKSGLLQELATVEQPQPLLHPNMAEIYRRKVTDLHVALNEEGTRLEAAEILRSLIEEIALVPEDGALRIEVRGDLAAAILNNATNAKSPSLRDGLVAQVEVVAGEGFEPSTFRL